jgi:hypothetical protein
MRTKFMTLLKEVVRYNGAAKVECVRKLVESALYTLS